MWQVNEVNPTGIGSATVKPGAKSRKRTRTKSTNSDDTTMQAQDLPTAKLKKAKRSKRTPKGKSGSPAAGSEGLAGDFENWDWSQVHVGDNQAFGNDMGGFVCLEEIDGVDCTWEDTGMGGKIVKFRKVGRGSKKPTVSGAKAQPTQPLSQEMTESFIHLDGLRNRPASDSSDADDGNADEVFTGCGEESEAVETTTNQKSSLDPASEEELLDQEDPENDVLEEPDTQVVDGSRHNGAGAQAKTFDATFDISAWNDLKLCKAIRQALQKLRFSHPTPIQERTLPYAMAGRDIVGAAETGSGKTLGFGIPMIQHYLKHKAKLEDQLIGLILTPTRELAIQIKDHLKQLTTFGRMRIVTVVGGMSAQKQLRTLQQSPNIIVATPGRFWDLLKDVDDLAHKVQRIRFLAIDEADRLLERGHFEELTSILRVVYDTRDAPRPQTFVFSATITKKFQFQGKNGKSGKRDPLQVMMERIQFKDKKPVLVDVTQTNGMAQSLREVKINCLSTTRDLHLYYLVTRYPARTLVFMNSIDAIRRLVPILRLLDVAVYPLHAGMEQRARLKNVDRFKANPRAVLVASDVAARGLDIPLVEHVVHYQIPRAADTYVHRSGRTARAQKEGISIMLCCPEEREAFQRITKRLKKTNVPEFPVEQSILSELQKRVALAQRIEHAEFKARKATVDMDWYQKSADAMGIEVDSDYIPKIKKLETKSQNAVSDGQVKLWKQELQNMLKAPIIPKSVSKRFVSSGLIHDLAKRLSDSTTYNSSMPTFEQRSAIEDLDDHQSLSKLARKLNSLDN
ncbi:ATP-dependent RNA helicase [Dimargaris verticillata]|uniref:RNA helicase n=1 Tax=Dimargaris verticillata TaxID=2761393 RepID=A0A9W8B035_9FUNG|nr:ATP-dependent RNA helicase [Dimargaris verticillata]